MLSEQIRGLIRDGVLPLERALALVTTNAARVLALPRKGRLEPGADADVVVLDGDIEIRRVLVGGLAV